MKRYLIVFLAALLLAATACAPDSVNEEQGIVMPIYFLAPADAVRGGDILHCSMEPLELEEGASVDELATAIVKRLLSGSLDGTLSSPFPKDAALLSLTIRNARAYVDLSGITRMDGIDLTLADYCLTLSLTAIEGIESVAVTGNGRLLAQQPRRIFYPHDVLLSSDDSILQQIQVKLYFLDSDGALTPETRTLDLYEGETQSAVLLTALLAGPKTDDLISVIPEDFSISSIKVEDGICRIHLSAAALQTLPPDEYTQNLILWSLAESLYSLDYIHEIRLMTDSGELEKFGLVPVASIAMRAQG